VPARISGVTLPNKRIEVALTYVYGVGRPLSISILKKVKIPFDKRADDLSEDEISKIRAELEFIPHEGDLRRKLQNDLKRLSEIGCYRGYRHRRRLPCRGQRTQTNARTRKGKKVTIANKKQ
jgi:small subunit ribosomal protein S13